jgi:hypothetical protein
MPVVEARNRHAFRGKTVASAVSLAADLVKRINDYYLSSSDFNGLSLDRLLTSEQPAVLESLRLATSGSRTVTNT